MPPAFSRDDVADLPFRHAEVFRNVVMVSTGRAKRANLKNVSIGEPRAAVLRADRHSALALGVSHIVPLSADR